MGKLFDPGEAVLPVAEQLAEPLLQVPLPLDVLDKASVLLGGLELAEPAQFVLHFPANCSDDTAVRVAKKLLLFVFLS